MSGVVCFCGVLIFFLRYGLIFTIYLSRSGEMVYTPALGAGAFGNGGSSPLYGTKKHLIDVLLI